MDISIIIPTNIEEYESKIYKLFRRLYYHCFGEYIEFEELYNVIKI